MAKTEKRCETEFKYVFHLDAMQIAFFLKFAIERKCHLYYCCCKWNRKLDKRDWDILN